MASKKLNERYVRQLELIGEEGQLTLSKSSVLVIGSGGLGSPVITGLVGAGIGNIGIVDFDIVEISNLNRQTLHNESFIGESKTASAKSRINSMNGNIDVKTYDIKLTLQNAKNIFQNYDVIIDCVDNYETRQTVSQVAVELKIPVIEGGIEGFFGFVQIILPGKTACFNCLGINNTKIFKQVLGVSTAIIGSIQALECIKYLCNLLSDEYSYISINMLDYTIDTAYLKSCSTCSCFNINGENK